jgi:hypothetical protein
MLNRAEAIEQGHRLYLGKPCKHGHSGTRYVTNRFCVECFGIKQPGKYKHDNKEQRTRNVRSVEKSREWYRSLDDEAKIVHNAGFYQRNKMMIKKYARERMGVAVRATPRGTDMTAMKAIHDAAPEGFHVDHVIPLKGRLVCGLNIPGNLQAIPAEQNHRKSNWFCSDEWHYLPDVALFYRIPLPCAPDMQL